MTEEQLAALLELFNEIEAASGTDPNWAMHMGLLVRDAFPRLVAEVRRLRGQLPAGMERCTIVYKKCGKGHGWLTATNWVEFGCPTCERDQLRAKLMEAADYIEQAEAELERLQELSD